MAAALVLVALALYIIPMFMIYRRTTRGPTRGRLLGGLNGVALGTIYLLRASDGPDVGALVLVALMIGGAGIALWVITVNARYQNGEAEYWSAAAVTGGFVAMFFLRGLNGYIQLGGALLGIVIFYGIERAMGRPFSQPPDLRAPRE